MFISRKSLFILAALAASYTLAYEARTVSITDTHYTDGLATSFDLAFGQGSAANALYVAYGSFDGGADPKAWQNLVKLADIAPGTSTYTAAAPTGWGTTVNALRFFMAEIADLPYDAALEYVSTTGAEYADTGYLPTSDTSVAIDMAYIDGDPSRYSSVWVPVWGYIKNSSTDKFAFFVHKTMSQFSFNYKNTSIQVDSGLAVGERFIFRNDNARQYVTRVERGESEVLLGENVADQTFAAETGWTIALNGYRKSTSSIENRSLQMRIYGMKILESGVLQRDYVPCRMDGAVGLYDKVNNTFLTPVSSLNRAFVAGPTTVEDGGFGAVSAIPATVFASGAAPSGSATRVVTVTATNRIAGAIVSLGLSFSPSYATNYLYVAYGATDGGNTPASWDNLDFVKVVEPYENGATVPVPAGWGDSVLAMRLFLGAPPSKPYDYDIEWLATTGSQSFDTGAHLLYGQSFTYTWRQFGTTYLISNDAGWSTGSGKYSTVGGGARNSGYIKTYLKDNWYQMTPNFATSELTSDVIYRDECVVGNYYSYTMTDIASGTSFVLSKSNHAPQDGASYDSGSNIILGRNIDSNPIPGRKAIYRATLADTSTGVPVFDLVPVVSNGVPCLYDLVSGAIVQNAGAGEMPQGPKVTPRLPSTSFDGSSATVSIVDVPRVVAGAVSAVPDSYTSVSIAFDVRSLGGAAAVDVDVNYGPSADAMSASARIASGASLGASSGTLHGLFPGRTYYAQLVASANGSAGAPSTTFTFTCPSPDSPAGGAFSRIISAEADGPNATVTFSPWSTGTLPLYVAYGADYGGETTNGWDNVVKVGDIAASTTSASVALPAGWGSTVRFLSFFLLDEVEILDKVVTSGTQYIDTGLYPNRNFKAEVRAKVLSGSTIDRDWFPLIGERRTSGTKFNLVLWLPKDPSNVNIHPSAGDQKYDIGDQNTGSPASNLKTYSFSVQEGLFADGTLVSAPSAFVDTTKVADLTLRLFGMVDGGTMEARKFYGECEYFKAYTNSVLVQHLVPCAISGMTNMFDLVTERVFENQGTGSFAGGNAISNATFFSYSEIVIAPDASSPVLGETAVSGEWRGDRATVSGTLAGAGAGDCRIVVETSRLGDFTDVVTWEANGTYGTGDAFSVELYDANPLSPSYIAPGETTWYRVKATDSAGTLDASVPASFTTQAAMAIGNPSISSDGKVFTVTVPVVAVGANTNWFWVVHSAGNALLDHVTDKVEVPHDYAGASVTISAMADTTEPATLSWAVVVSNDCSTAVWTTTSPTMTRNITNNLRYTWKKAVSAGNWEDAANWDAPEGRFNWPTVNSQAYFANVTTAAVTIASSLLEVTDILANANDVNLTFTGDRTTRMLKTNTFQTNAKGGRICVSNLAFQAASGDVNVDEGRTLVFHDADVEVGGYLGPRGGPDRHLVISGGSYVKANGSFGVGGDGSDIIIDDSYVDQCTRAYGFFFSSSAAGGDIILKGRNPRLEAVSNARSAQNMSCGGRLVFVVPEGGFAETPVRQIPDQHKAGQWDESRQFFSNAPQYVAETQPSQVVIDPDSPALRGGAITQTLVEWRNGIALDKTILGAIPKPRSNRFVFSGGFDSHDDWTTDWTDSENAPCALGFRRERGTTFLILQ